MTTTITGRRGNVLMGRTATGRKTFFETALCFLEEGEKLEGALTVGGVYDRAAHADQRAKNKAAKAKAAKAKAAKAKAAKAKPKGAEQQPKDKGDEGDALEAIRDFANGNGGKAADTKAKSKPKAATKSKAKTKR